MRSLLKFLVPAALLASLGCQPQPIRPVLFVPWEEGLTLAYEDPSLPQPLRSERRLQVRVAHTTMQPDGPSLVQLDLTNTLGRMSVLLKPHDGGLDVVGAGGQVVAQALPPHFPDTPRWGDRETECQVIGRAAWGGAALLPSTSDPVGVWVEVRSSRAPHRRSLYLPNLGEVESMEERAGRWVIVNRLVARGFTDLPAIKPS